MFYSVIWGCCTTGNQFLLFFTLVKSPLFRYLRAVKQLIVFLIFISFSVNQFHLLEYFATFKNVSTIETLTDKTSPSDEHEKANKELEDFTTTVQQNHLLLNPLALLKNNFFFVNLMYSHPFTQKDIKPPCYV